MKALAVSAAATILVAALASPTLAAPAKHRNQVSNSATTSNGRAAYGASGNVVTLGNRVVGQDPDPNIRLQILRDPTPGNY